MSVPGRTKLRRRHADMPLAWLAVVALLINALLPAALGAESGAGKPGFAAGFCGRAPVHPPPGLPQPDPGEHHCPLCCAAPPGVPPLCGSRIAGPKLIGEAVVAVAPEAQAPSLLPYGSPQPRGPPAQA